MGFFFLYLISVDVYSQLINVLNQIKDLVDSDAQQLIQGSIVNLVIQKYANEINALQILPPILQKCENELKVLIPKLNNPILKNDFKLILNKLQELVNNFNQGKGSFLENKIFNQYSTNLLTNFLSSL